jgi:Icc protein
MSDSTVYFVQISDTHIGPTPGFANHGITSVPVLQRLVDRINQLPQKPDFVIHSGDVTDAPNPSSYSQAKEILSRLRVPIYYVRGNHDSALDIKAYMDMGLKEDIETGEDRLTYKFDRKGFQFLVLDTMGPLESQPQGYLSAAQLKLLHEEAKADRPPLIVFLHHPVLPMDSPWMDANMPIINGAEVHDALRAAKKRLRGVFFGHIHQSIQTTKDGILYVAAPSSVVQLTSWPSDNDVGIQEDEQPGFNFVRLMPEQTMIHQHRFPRP